MTSPGAAKGIARLKKIAIPFSPSTDFMPFLGLLFSKDKTFFLNEGCFLSVYELGSRMLLNKESLLPCILL